MGRKKPDTRYPVSRYGRSRVYISPTGVETRLYNIGTAAEAIGREPQTIRRWEVSGVIPLTPFKIGGRRMYSDEHLDALVECAEKYHIRPGVKIQDTGFSALMYKRYEEIHHKFFVGDSQPEEEKEEKEDGENVSEEKPKLKGWKRKE